MLAEINTLRKCNDVKQYVKLHFMKYELARDSFKKVHLANWYVQQPRSEKMYNTLDRTYKCGFGDGWEKEI